MRELDCIQGTPEWLHIRCGRLTASRMGDVVSKRKRGTEELACRRDYRLELVCERLTGRVAEHYVSPEMDRGSALEPYARAAYEVATGSIVDQVGFILHPKLDFSGASPDSLVDSSGGIEIKCPKTATHLDWMMARVVPEEHRPQMYWNMACGERAWWEFMSYDDRLPEGLRIFCARLERDEKIIAEMEYAAMEFNAEVEAKCEQLLPGFKWNPIMPKELSSQTVRIGSLDVPADIAEFLDSDAAELGCTP